MARANNSRDGITGLLLSGNGHFVQVIEGDEAPVAALYARILADSRHRQVFQLYRDVAASELVDVTVSSRAPSRARGQPR